MGPGAGGTKPEASGWEHGVLQREGGCHQSRAPLGPLMCGGVVPARVSSGWTRPAGGPGWHSASPPPRLRAQGKSETLGPQVDENVQDPRPGAGAWWVGGPSAQSPEPTPLHSPSSKAGPRPSPDAALLGRGWGASEGLPSLSQPPMGLPGGRARPPCLRALWSLWLPGAPVGHPGGWARPKLTRHSQPPQKPPPQDTRAQRGEHLYCRRVTGFPPPLTAPP